MLTGTFVLPKWRNVTTCLHRNRILVLVQKIWLASFRKALNYWTKLRFLQRNYICLWWKEIAVGVSRHSASVTVLSCKDCCAKHKNLLTYWDLDPPTPGEALTWLFHLLWLLATLPTPLQLTLISCKSSWNFCHKFFLGRPVLLLPPSGSHCIATLAGLSGGSCSMPCQCQSSYSDNTWSALFINSSLLMWSCHEMTNMVHRHSWWKTSNIGEILVVPFYVSAA